MSEKSVFRPKGKSHNLFPFVNISLRLNQSPYLDHYLALIWSHQSPKVQIWFYLKIWKRRPYLYASLDKLIGFPIFPIRILNSTHHSSPRPWGSSLWLVRSLREGRAARPRWCRGAAWPRRATVPARWPWSSSSSPPSSPPPPRCCSPPWRPSLGLPSSSWTRLPLTIKDTCLTVNYGVGGAIGLATGWRLFSASPPVTGKGARTWAGPRKPSSELKVSRARRHYSARSGAMLWCAAAAGGVTHTGLSGRHLVSLVLAPGPHV